MTNTLEPHPRAVALRAEHALQREMHFEAFRGPHRALKCPIRANMVFLKYIIKLISTRSFEWYRSRPDLQNKVSAQVSPMPCKVHYKGTVGSFKIHRQTNLDTLFRMV